MADALQRTFLPPDEPLDELATELHQPTAPSSIAILCQRGDRLAVGAEVTAALRELVDVMQHGHAVMIRPIRQRLTTREAADVLGVSRPRFLGLLDQGEIPLAITLGIYSHVSPTLHDEAASQVAGLIL